MAARLSSLLQMRHFLLGLFLGLALSAGAVTTNPNPWRGFMPNWFWNQSAEGLLGPNIWIDVQLPAQRVWCWRNSNADLVGVAINNTVTAKTVTKDDFRPLTLQGCKNAANLWHKLHP